MKAIEENYGKRFFVAALNRKIVGTVAYEDVEMTSKSFYLKKFKFKCQNLPRPIIRVQSLRYQPSNTVLIQ